MRAAWLAVAVGVQAQNAARNCTEDVQACRDDTICTPLLYACQTSGLLLLGGPCPTCALNTACAQSMDCYENYTSYGVTLAELGLFSSYDDGDSYSNDATVTVTEERLALTAVL